MLLVGGVVSQRAPWDGKNCQVKQHLMAQGVGGVFDQSMDHGSELGHGELKMLVQQLVFVPLDMARHGASKAIDLPYPRRLSI